MAFGNISLVYLLDGMLYIALAAVSLGQARGERSHWVWLALFGLFQGMEEWLEVAAIILGEPQWLHWVRLAALSLAHLSLLEFARIGAEEVGWGGLGRWMYLPYLGALQGAALWLGAEGLPQLIQMGVVLPGCLGAALVLFRYGVVTPGWRSMILAGMVFIGYGLLKGVLDLDDADDVRIQLAEAAMALLVIWVIWRRPTLDGLSSLGRRRRSSLFRLILGLVVLAGVGGNAIEYLNNIFKQEMSSDTKQDVLLCASGFAKDVILTEKAAQGLAGMVDRLPAKEDAAGLAKLNHVVDQMVPFRDDIAYFMDRDGLTIASSNREAGAASLLGKNFRFRPYFQEAMAGRVGRYFAYGISTRAPGYYASYPVLAADGAIQGVAVVKRTLTMEKLDSNLLGEIFLINRQGVVLLAGDPKQALHPMWPLSEATKKELIDSRQFGDIEFSSPLYPQEIHDGDWLDGTRNRLYAARQEINPEGWSLVLLRQERAPMAVRLLGAIIAFLLVCFLMVYYIALLREEKSDERLRKLSRAVEQSPAAIVITDQTGRIDYVNPRFTAMTGYSAAEALNAPWSFLHSPEAPPEIYQAMWQMLQAGGEWRGELLHRKKNQELYWEENAITPILNGEGAITHFLAVKEDITQRKHLEQELVAAKEEAEKASRAKSLFLANMSHEIRTPMNGVVGMLELLKSTELTPLQRDYLDTAERSAELQMGVLNDILDFSKIEAGKLVLETIRFDLLRQVEQTAQIMAMAAFRKGIEMGVHLEPDLPWTVIGDPTRLRQVLINLLGNAIKFTDRGEVVLRVSRLPDNGAGEAQLRFEVKDTGVGIEPRTLERLFQPFTQADESMTRRFGGTGLGLTISRQLVEAMGGKMEVESSLGKGSIFRFILPFRPCADQSGPNWGGFHNLRVLVVDDNETNRVILEGYFSSRVASVVLAANGSEALAKLWGGVAQETPFDLVILDHHMPGMTGMELARRIRAESGLAGAKLVLLSSGILPGADDLTAGRMDMVLSKPVTFPRLWDALAELFTEGKEHAAIVHSQDMDRRFSGLVLLAEDAFVNQQVAVGMLSRYGLTVRVAGNGREAVSLAKGDRFDLILMDVQMPEMDGFEATAEIRHLQKGRGDPPTPIIAMTAHALTGDRERCLEAGMDDYLAKPVRWGELAEKLARWLPNQATKSPADGTPSGQDEAKEQKTEQENKTTEEQTSPAIPEPVILDARALKSLQTAMGGKEAMAELLHMYLTEMAQGIIGMEEALAVGKLDKIRLIAHSLKSQSATVGAKELALVLREMERLGTERQTDGMAEQLAQIQMEFARAQPALEALSGTKN